MGRVRQILARGARFYHTVKYLRGSQVVHRIWFKVFRPGPPVVDRSKVKPPVSHWAEPVAKQQSYFRDGKFCFLNTPGKVGTAGDWNEQEFSKLWLYNLHYFDDLLAGNAVERQEEHHKLISQWIEENPPVSGNGWEPYPLSLRLVNWIKWHLSGNELSEKARDSLALQAAYLAKRCEYHLMGNHLFVNGKALVFAGLYFEGKQAGKWLRQGQKIIRAQITEQILPDGANFELSPMYHALFLEDVLDLINIGRTYGHSLAEELTEYVVPMLKWLRTMSHPDGDVSFFNDSAVGIAPKYSDLRNYAENLGFKISETEQRLIYHKDSGYVRLNGEKYAALLDIAPIGPDYIPGHAHADSLSFELSVAGKRCLVNSGTSVYGISDERLRQRGTAAHNTVVVDGENSSEVWSGFRVARRARIEKPSVTADERETVVAASHTGYKRLKGKPEHYREWKFRDSGILITDQISSSRSHHISIVFHIHPDWAVFWEDGKIILQYQFAKVYVTLPAQGAVSIEESSYHPEFGLSVPNKRVFCQYDGNCDTPFVTAIRFE